MDCNNSMDSLYNDSTWFYIPMRYVWDNWEDFLQEDTIDTLIF